MMEKNKFVAGNIEICVPQPVAYMHIAGIKCDVYSKEMIPNRFVRFMQKHILGIIWEIVEK